MKRKIKTMKPEQEPTDEEIARYKDFDKLLREKQQFDIRQKRLTKIKIAAGILTLITLVGFFMVMKPEPQSPKRSVVEQHQPGAPTITDNMSPEAREESTIVIDEKVAEAKDEPAAPTETAPGKKATKPLVKPAVKIEKPMEPTKTETSGELKVVYQQPEPVNGYPDLYAYFDRELTYPQSVMKDSVQGVVTVLFSINAQGKAEDVRIENSLGKAFDDEVLRVVANMPLWKPAYYNGRVMKSKVSLPLTFELKKVSSKE